MASEICHEHQATGSNLYFTVRNTSRQYWNTDTDGPAFETLTVANWYNELASDGNYWIEMPETPLGSYFYVGDWPATLTTVGWYYVTVYLRAGANPAISDTRIVTYYGYWDGTTYDIGKMGLTPEACQDVSQEIHGSSGTVWHIEYGVGEDLTGDGLSWNTAKVTAGAGLKTVIEAASPGDIVLIGPGTFALSTNVLNVPDGVAVFGAGMDFTVITSTAVSSTHGAIVKPPSSSCLNDMTIKGLNSDGTYQYPLGTHSSAGQSAYTNSVGRRLRLIADTDGYYARHSTDCSMLLFDCIINTKFDTVNQNLGNHTVKLYGCVLNVTGPSTASGDNDAHGVTGGNGALCELFDCNVSVRDAEDETVGIRATTGATVRMHGGTISVSSSGTAYSVKADGGTALLCGVEYDRSATLTDGGTISDVARVITGVDGYAQADVKEIKGVDADTAITARAQQAIVNNNLDHLLKTATGSADMTTEVADNTIISRVIAAGDTSAFVPTTHSVKQVATHSKAIDDLTKTGAAGDLAEINTNTAETLATMPTAAENADAVWDEARTGHNTAGTFGAAVTAYPVSVTPLTATVSAGAVSEHKLTAYQNSRFGPYVFTATDSDSNVINLNGKTVKLTMYKLGAPATALHTLSTTASEIAISSTDYNIITVTGTDSITGTAGLFNYQLENTTDDQMLDVGTVTIEAAHATT